jgi:hypothetical protein
MAGEMKELSTTLADSAEKVQTTSDSKKLSALAGLVILDMKNVLDQSIASAMSAKDEKDEELLNAIRCISHRVRDEILSLQQIQAGLKARGADVSALKQEMLAQFQHMQDGMTQINQQVQETHSMLATHNSMIHGLLLKLEKVTNPVPLNMLFFPKVSDKKLLSRFKDKLWKKTVLVFVCSLSFQVPERSGPDLAAGGEGRGYILETNTKLLKKLLPLIAMSVVLVKMLLAANGIPPTILPFPAVNQFVESVIVDSLDDMRKQASQSASSGSEEEKSAQTLQGAVYDVYRLVSRLEGGRELEPSSGWVPLQTGLELVSPNAGVEGESLWILPKYKALYQCRGRALLAHTTSLMGEERSPEQLREVQAYLDTELATC